jgi:hypothetical protein
MGLSCRTPIRYLLVAELAKLTRLNSSALLVGELVSRTRLCRTKRLSIVLREGVPFRVEECIYPILSLNNKFKNKTIISANITDFLFKFISDSSGNKFR